jgi:hypothetical protein
MDAGREQRKDGELVDIGQVGEMYQHDPASSSCSTRGDFIPVVAPIGTDEEGNAYNINADLAAGKIAGVLQAEKVMIHDQHAAACSNKTGELMTGLDAARGRRADRRRHHQRRHDSQGGLRGRRGEQRRQNARTSSTAVSSTRCCSNSSPPKALAR